MIVKEVMQKEMKQKMKRSDYEKMAQQHWDSLGKPIDSLGVLEKHVTKLCGMQRTTQPHIEKRALVVLCADHGCVREGVTQTDSSVTRTVAENFARGLTTTSVLAKQFAVDLFPVDVGMLPAVQKKSRTPHRVTPGDGHACSTKRSFNDDDTCYTRPALSDDHLLRTDPSLRTDFPLRTDRVNERCLQWGSGDIAIESAMSEEVGEWALALGRKLVRELKAQGYEILLTGEMGIGNTTPTSALFSALLGLPVEETVGRGAGLSDEGLMRKQDCVRRALQRVGILSEAGSLQAPADSSMPPRTTLSTASELNEASEASGTSKPHALPSPARAKQLLFELGGLEIATMTGMFLGAAEEELPIVIDGAISTAAALAATLIDADVRSYALASHISKDGAARKALDALGLRAILDADLSLGEGSGAVLLLPMLDAALAVYRGMGSFDDIHVEAYHRFM